MPRTKAENRFELLFPVYKGPACFHYTIQLKKLCLVGLNH